jgi:hypothetical protein
VVADLRLLHLACLCNAPKNNKSFKWAIFFDAAKALVGDFECLGGTAAEWENWLLKQKIPTLSPRTLQSMRGLCTGTKINAMFRTQEAGSLDGENAVEDIENLKTTEGSEEIPRSDVLKPALATKETSSIPIPERASEDLEPKREVAVEQPIYEVEKDSKKEKNDKTSANSSRSDLDDPKNGAASECAKSSCSGVLHGMHYELTVSQDQGARDIISLACSFEVGKPMPEVDLAENTIRLLFLGKDDMDSATADIQNGIPAVEGPVDVRVIPAEEPGYMKFEIDLPFTCVVSEATASWKRKTGRLVVTMPRVMLAGGRLASGSGDQMIKIWDLTTA